jgi:hypothetical protein
MFQKLSGGGGEEGMLTAQNIYQASTFKRGMKAKCHHDFNILWQKYMEDQN